MFKKKNTVFNFVLAVFMMLNVVLLPIGNPYCVFAETAVLTEDNFDSGVFSPEKWSDQTDVNLVEIVNENGNNALKLKAPAGGKGVILSKKITDAGFNYTSAYTAVKFRVKILDGTGTFKYYFRNLLPDIDQWLSLVKFSKGKLLDNNDKPIADVKTGEWNEFMLVIDARSKSPYGEIPRYCIFMNNEKKSPMHQIINAFPGTLKTEFFKTAPIASFGVDSAANEETQVLVDDIKIYKLEDYEETNVKMEALGQIYKPGEAYFNFEISHSHKEATVPYTIEYSVKNAMDSELVVNKSMQIDVPKGKIKTSKIKLDNVKKNGAYLLEVKLKSSEGEVIETTNQKFVIMPDYQRQFMDKYTNFGINTHFDWIKPDEQKLQAEYMSKIGFRFARVGAGWSSTEKEKGQYNFDKLAAILDNLAQYDIQPFEGFWYNNPLYLTDQEKNAVSYAEQAGVRTRANIEGFAAFAAATVKRFPQLKLMNIWNEPDTNGFWKPGYNYLETANLNKAAALAIKKVNPEATVIAHNIGSRMSKEYTDDFFKQGVLSYTDAWDGHVYLFSQDPQERLVPVVYANGRSHLDAMGGWKDIYMSEIGYTTVIGNMGTTEEQEMDYMVKSFILQSTDAGIKLALYYDFKDDGVDPYNAEHNFGLIHNDFSPKPIVITLNQLFRQIQGARYIGHLDAGDGISTYMYSKEGKPVMVAWTGKDIKSFDFGQQVNVEDLFGNPSQKGQQINIDSKPEYIMGLDNKWFARAAGNSISKEYGDWLTKWTVKVGDPSLVNVKNGVQSLKDYAEGLKNAEKVPSVDEVTGKLDSNYDMAEAVAKALKENKAGLDYNNAMLMMYELHEIGVKWAHLLSVADASAGSAATVASDAMIQEMSQKLKDRFAAVHGGTMRFTQDILAKAKEFNDIVNDVKDDSSSYKAGIVISYDKLACRLAALSKLVFEFEPMDSNYNILLSANPAFLNLFGGELNKTFDVSVMNYKDIPLSGKLGAYNEAGELVSKQADVSLKANESNTYPITMAIPELPVGTSLQYSIMLMKDDQQIQALSLPVNVVKSLDIKLDAAAATVEALKQVSLNIKGLVDIPVEGSIKVSGPNGWKINKATQSFKVGKNETVKLNFGIGSTKKVAFNQYIFNVEVSNKEGKVINTQNLPLNFSMLVKEKNGIAPQDFDGNIAAWSDAYPDFINPPAHPESIADWKNSNCAGRVFAKWDDNYIYVLADVYDDQHQVNNRGFESWNADSIQLSFDTKNAKTKDGYSANDYEITFYLHSSGAQVYEHFAGDSKKMGDKPAEWTKIIRDNNNKNTRYYMRIPKADLAPLDLKNNTIFGLNAVINDADVIYRDSYYEITPGTGLSKNPSVYYNYKMQPQSSKAALDPNTASAFMDVSINQTAAAITSSFEDIADHWAKNDIEEMVNQQIIKGMDDKHFGPEAGVTRAEVLALAVRALNLPLKDYHGAYTDVGTDGWYAKVVQTAYNEGLIDPGMVSGGNYRPDDLINREEIASIIVNAYNAAKKTRVQGKGLDTFADKDEISQWASEYVSAANTIGLMKGVSEDLFEPKSGATRAQAAVLVNRLLKAIK